MLNSPVEIVCVTVFGHFSGTAKGKKVLRVKFCCYGRFPWLIKLSLDPD